MRFEGPHPLVLQNHYAAPTNSQMYKKLIDGLHAAFGQKYGGLNNTRQSAET